MILVSFSEPDRPIAVEIATELTRLGHASRLDPRADWISQALCGFGGAARVVVVVSERNVTDWWLPFLVGRASERGIPLVAYRIAGAGADLPFLRRVTPIDDDVGALEPWLRTEPSEKTTRP